MTLDEVLQGLFPDGCRMHAEQGVLQGEGSLAGRRIHVLGLIDGTSLGVEQAITLAARVLAIGAMPTDAPVLLLLDSGSQRFAKRDELLGLHEYLAHLAKALILVDLSGHRTVALLYGHTAAGAFIATGLAASTLVALPGATPAVMDLPSMARVTKLPLEILKEKAQSTPVFAPGLSNFMLTGAVSVIWEEKRSLAAELSALLTQDTAQPPDERDRLGEQRRGRVKAAEVAMRVFELATRA